MANVIREDVIKISFDIGEELKKLNDSVDEFKKKISGGVGGDAFDDFKKSVNGTDSEIDGLKKSISGLGKSTESYGSTATKVGQNIKKAFSSAGSTIKTLSTQVDSAADKIQSKIFNVKNLIAGIATGLVVQQSIDVVVDRQNITSQFEVLLGSAEAAQKRVQELTDFASLTPFTRDEIFAASKQLQVFTGDALSTGDSLRIIGDVAAGTGQEFEEVALWTGRLYDAMKSGRPVGEMTARLQEMGAISGENRSKIEALAAAGGNISERWAEVETIFGRYNGTMEKLSNNLGNMLTSLKSFATNSIFLPIGEGIAQGLQPAIQKFREFRKTNKDDVEAMGTVFKNFAEKLCIPLFIKLESGVEGLIKVIGALKDGVSGLEKFKGKSAFLDGIIEAIKFINENKDMFISGLQGIGIALGGIVIASKINKLATAFKFLASPLGIVSAIAVGLFMKFKADGGTIPELISKISETLKKANPILEVAKSMLSWLGDSLEFLGKHIKVILPLVISLVAAFKGLSLIKSITGFFSKTKGESSGGFFSGIVSTFKELAKVNTKTILKGIANMTIILGSFTILTGIFMAIAPSLSALSDIKTVAKMLLAITALGLVGMSLTKFSQIAGKVPIMTVIKGLANMAIMLAGMSALYMVIGAVSLINFDIKEMLKISAMLLVLGAVGTALSVFAGIVGLIPIPIVLSGLANIALVVAGMALLFMAIGAVSLLGFDTKEILKISAVMLALGTVGTVLSIFAGIVGLIPIPVVLAGLANIALVIGGLTALIIAFGALSEIPHFNEFITSGGETLANLFGQLGKICGSLIGGFGAGIADSLPSLGANLSAFATALQPMFTAFEGANLTGVSDFFKSFGEFMLSMAANDILSFITGGTDLSTIGIELTTFADGVSGFFDKVATFPAEGFTNAKLLFQSLSDIGNVPKTGGLVQWFSGDFDFIGLANGLQQLSSERVIRFYNTVSQIPAEAFESAKALFQSLSDIGNIPKTGGISQWFSGETDFTVLSTQLPAFGEAMKSFYTSISGIEDFGKIKELFKALEGIEEMMPKEGGVFNKIGEAFGGEVSLETLGASLKQFGEDAAGFFTQINGLDIEKLNSLWSSLKGFDGISDSLATNLSSMAEPLGMVATEFSNLCLSIGITVIQASLLQGLLSSVLSFTRSISSEFAKAAESPALLSVALGVLETDAAAKMARLVTVMRAAMKSINTIMEDSASEINNTMATCINDLVDKISQLPQKMGDGLRNSGSYLSSALTEIWQDAVIASAGPVNKVIEGANWILEQFGSSDSIASWTPYAKGTDGHRGGNALVNDGRGAELVQMPNGRSFIPQGRNVFIPNAPKGMKVLPAEQTAQLMGKKSPTFKYAEGTGDIDIFSFMDNASGLIDKVTEKYVSYDGLSGLALKIGKGMVTTITKRMVDWSDKLFDQLGAISLANYSPSAGVEQWRSLVIQALKMEGVYSPENVERTLFQMQTESGGNPMAINLWDSNAAAGIPSKGLMQCIDPTFRAYARPGFDTNIYDPLSNILASIRYALARYGSLANAYRGVGYANGGLVTKPGFIGEEGQEMVIPLNRDKRKRAIGLWQETGSALGVYTPENSSGYSGNSTVEENNTYAPTFNITVNGSMTDRATVNETKRQFYEMLNEYFESLERKNRLIRQT